MSGYCPVSLVDSHRLVPGLASLRAEYDGQTYRFAAEAARDAFLRPPAIRPGQRRALPRHPGRKG